MLCSENPSFLFFFFLFSLLNICHLTVFSPVFLSSASVSPLANLFLFVIVVFLPGGHSARVACWTPDDWPQQFHAFPLCTLGTLSNKWIWASAKTRQRHHLTVNTIGLKIHYSQSCWRQKTPFIHLFVYSVCLFHLLFFWDSLFWS